MGEGTNFVCKCNYAHSLRLGMHLFWRVVVVRFATTVHHGGGTGRSGGRTFRLARRRGTGVVVDLL